MADTPLSTAQVQQQATQALNEGVLHRGAVEFDDLCEVLGGMVWGDMPGQNAVPDETISSHVRMVSDDPNSKLRIPAKLLNAALNLIQKNHGAKAESGDLIRALRAASILMQALGIQTITLTADEDPAKIVSSLVVG